MRVLRHPLEWTWRGPDQPMHGPAPMRTRPRRAAVAPKPCRGCGKKDLAAITRASAEMTREHEA